MSKQEDILPNFSVKTLETPRRASYLWKNYLADEMFSTLNGGKKKKATNKLIMKGLVVIIFPIIAYYFWFPAIWRCQTVGFRGFEELNPSLLVSKETTSAERKVLLANLGVAQRRVENFWGERKGNADLIYCPNETDYARFCILNEGAACTLGTPTGAWIVASQEGLSVDVLAHELMHDELFARMGWLKTKAQIPHWFDEGLAIMADYRLTDPDTLHRYVAFHDEWKIQNQGRKELNLSEIAHFKDFFGVKENGQPDEAATRRAYLRAGLEVSRWLAIVGRQGLHELLHLLNEGHNFDTAYLSVERSHLPVPLSP